MFLSGIEPKLYMDSIGNLCPYKSPPLAIPGQKPNKNPKGPSSSLDSKHNPPKLDSTQGSNAFPLNNAALEEFLHT